MSEEKEPKKEMTIEDLAVMVQNGFLSMEEKIVGNVRTEITRATDSLKNELKGEIRELKDELKAELNKKVDIFTHKELEYRVERMEEKSGLMVRDE